MMLAIAEMADDMAGSSPENPICSGNRHDMTNPMSEPGGIVATKMSQNLITNQSLRNAGATIVNNPHHRIRQIAIRSRSDSTRRRRPIAGVQSSLVVTNHPL